MIQSRFDDIKILGIATAVPRQKENIVETYENVFGQKVVQRVSNNIGVQYRHVTTKHQTASDLAYVAARHLIESKHIDVSQIGILIFVTQTPDYRIPSTACILHNRLALAKDCIAFDMNLGCSGYVYGLQTICSLMNSTTTKYALLLVGDTISKCVDSSDESTAMVFGDAGSATLLEKTDCIAPIQIACRTNGTGYKTIRIPAGAYRDIKDVQERDSYFYMHGIDTFNFSVIEVPEIINEYFESNQLEGDTFDGYIFHQANTYILKQIVKRAKIPQDRVPISMDRYGNTSVATIPLTICDAYGKDENQEKVSLMMCGFGVGLSWGIGTLTIDVNDILPIIETEEYYEEGECTK